MELTICIPYYNDAYNLNNLLQSIYENYLDEIDYEIIVCGNDPKNDVEVIVSKWIHKIPVSLIITPNKSSASINLNRGLEKASGKIFCRVDSHCILDKDYLRQGMTQFKKKYPKYSAIGPSVNIIGRSEGLISKLIAKLYMSPFLLGPSKFKRSFFYKNYSGPTDSIFLGFYLTDDLLGLQGFNEKISKKQDIELLTRLKNKKGQGFYNSNLIKVDYILKHDSLFLLSKRCFNQGYILFESLASSRSIHFIPISSLIIFLIILAIWFPIGLILLFSYLSLCILFGLIEKTSAFSFFLAPIIFPILHISYVLGNLIGLSKKMLKK